MSVPHGPSLLLATPDAALGASYRGLLAEVIAAEEALIPFPLAFPSDDIDALLVRLDACARGIDLPEGFVPHSTYWLVRDGAEVVGVANLRHALTPALRVEGGNIGYGIRPSARGRGYGVAILALALERARDLGLDRVLLTCAKTNVASARSIERNGGVLADEAYLPARGEVVLRYWIDLDEPKATGASAPAAER